MTKDKKTAGAPGADGPSNGAPSPTPPAAEPQSNSGPPRKARTRVKGLRLPRRFKKPRPGSAAGLEPQDLSALPSTPGGARITCIDYCPEDIRFDEDCRLPEFID